MRHAKTRTKNWSRKDAGSSRRLKITHAITTTHEQSAGKIYHTHPTTLLCVSPNGVFCCRVQGVKAKSGVHLFQMKRMLLQNAALVIVLTY